MAEHLKLRHRVLERPKSHWKSLAVEMLGCQTRIVQGEKWQHRVLEKGSGPPLFLYHGVGGHVETYGRTLPMLAKEFHVYAVDALYHGYSSKEPWDTDNHTLRRPKPTSTSSTPSATSGLTTRASRWAPSSGSRSA